MRKLKMKRVILSGFLSAMLLMSGAFQAFATDTTADPKTEPDIADIPIEQMVEIEKQEEILPEVVVDPVPAEPEKVVLPEEPEVVPEVISEPPVATAPVAEEPVAMPEQKLALKGLGLIDWNRHLDKVDCEPGWDFDWNIDIDLDWDWDCDCDIDFDWGGFPDLDIGHLPKDNLVKLEFEKKWYDGDAKHPHAVFMELSANDKVVAYFPVSKLSGWKLHFYAPKGIHGEDFVYTVREVPVHGYESMVEKDGNKFTVNNYALGWLHVMKEWQDDANRADFRPEEVNYQILKNGELLPEMLTLTKENCWEALLTLPMYDKNGAIDYTVKEVPIEGYETTYTENHENILDGKHGDCCHGDVAYKRIMIVNRWTNKREITLEKIWVNNEEAYVPDMVTFSLYQNDVMFESHDLTGANGWKKTIQVPIFDDENNRYVYSVDEVNVGDGYESMVDGFTVTNTWKGVVIPNPKTVIIRGEKTWNDLMMRPEMITVNLYQNGEEFEMKEVKASENGKWLYEFKDLPEFDDMGMPYVYTVKESKIIGYKETVEGYNINNYQYRGTLILKKVNKEKVGLPGAVFAVYDLKGKLIKNLTTDADGYFMIDLPLGMYRVTEVTAPKGYDKKDFSRLVILTKEGEKFNLEIVNEKVKNGFEPLPDTGGTPGGGGYKPTLPKTGSANQPLLYVLGLFSLFVGASELSRKKRVY